MEKYLGDMRRLAASLVIAVSLLFALSAATLAQETGAADSSRLTAKPPYNIVFIIVDQRTYRLRARADYSEPSIDAIARHGVKFNNHYISSAMCSPSRASFLTGQPPQVTGVIDAILVRAQP